MMALLFLLTLLAAFAAALPSPTRVAKRSPTLTSRDDPATTICGDIIDLVNNGTSVFYASDAYDCLTSVPFNGAVALRLLNYYNTTIQFHSSLAYLKNPPQGYQQPAIDVLGGLEQIKKNITAGYYKNEYAFEADLQTLIYGIHDAHVDMYAGVLSAFTFACSWPLMTASVDGKQTPKIYLEDDIVQHQHGFTVSPITTINDEDVVSYLTKFAALQVVGRLEPHADWNDLMGSPARDIQGQLSIFSGGATFYPGDELNFKFENGSTLEDFWLAIYAEPYFTGPLTTGGDFYNYFVLGNIPASYDEVPLPPAYNFSSVVDDSSNDDSGLVGGEGGAGDGPGGEADDDSGDFVPFDASSAYPKKPDITQLDLDISGGGVLTGYFLNDSGVAVLSIPSFDQFGYDVGNFSKTVNDFIAGAKQAKLSNVILDLQHNEGGLVELAFVTYRQFFPGTTPFAGSRRRSFELANELGLTYTNAFIAASAKDKRSFEGVEWVVTDRINADTGKNFTSWAEYYGPRTANGDNFSLVEQYDLANPVFDEENFDGWVPTDFTAKNAGKTAADTPFALKDIVLLTDGMCSSACSLFVEMMTQAGVRSVVVGGRPTTGPMQAASGSRGAAYYDASQLDSDIFSSFDFSNDTTRSLPQNRETGININFAGFTLRDQVRKGDDVPLQFKYIPADCRLFFTLDNVQNMGQLWRDVATAAFSDSSKCVSGSTGQTKTGNGIYGISDENITPPPAPNITTPSVTGGNNVDYNKDAGVFGGTGDGLDLIDFGSQSSTKDKTFQQCNPKQASSDCTGGGRVLPCQALFLRCPDFGIVKQSLCAPQCNTQLPCPDNTMKCNLTTPVDGKFVPVPNKIGKGTHLEQLKKGNCVPKSPTEAMGCPVADDEEDDG